MWLQWIFFHSPEASGIHAFLFSWVNSPEILNWTQEVCATCGFLGNISKEDNCLFLPRMVISNTPSFTQLNAVLHAFIHVCSATKKKWKAEAMKCMKQIFASKSEGSLPNYSLQRNIIKTMFWQQLELPVCSFIHSTAASIQWQYELYIENLRLLPPQAGWNCTKDSSKTRCPEIHTC